MKVKRTFVSFTSQSTTLVELPDIPGQVVQVRAVHWFTSSFSQTASFVAILDHNISLAVTLSTTEDRESMWFPGIGFVDVDGPSEQPSLRYDPPYELIGKQRFDHLATAGAMSGMLVILYTLRRESNRTVWNELRSRTSFEKG